MDKAINERIMNANAKHDATMKYMAGLDANTFGFMEALLKHDFQLGIPLEDIRRVYPDIPDIPAVVNSSVEDDKSYLFSESVGDSRFDVNIIVGRYGNFRICTQEGRALILPDKIMSPFTKVFFNTASNIVFQAHFEGMTTRGKVSPRNTEIILEELLRGESQTDNFKLTVYDAVPYHIFNYSSDEMVDNHWTFAKRRAWLEQWHEKNGTELVDITTVINYNPSLKKHGYIYEDSSSWKAGYRII
jgi:hypothetical protein